MGLFEAGDPELVQLTLSNGVVYWELEWDAELQKELAANLGAILHAYLAGEGRFVKRRFGQPVFVCGRSVDFRYDRLKPELVAERLQLHP